MPGHCGSGSGVRPRAGKRPAALLCSFELTRKYFPPNRDKFKQTFISFVLKVSDLIPGVGPRLLRVHRSLLHPRSSCSTRAPPHSLLEIKPQEKSSPPAEKGEYPQAPAVTPRATGLGAQEHTDTPPSSAKPNVRAQGVTPRAGTATILTPTPAIAKGCGQPAAEAGKSESGPCRRMGASRLLGAAFWGELSLGLANRVAAPLFLY